MEFRLILFGLCVVLAEASVGQEPPSVGQEPPSMGFDAAFGKVAAHTHGEDREPLTVVADAIAGSSGNPQLRGQLIAKLVVLIGGDATLPGKDFACRQLALFGSEEAVPALGALLEAEDTAGMACRALERMPYPSVAEVLLDALGKTTGKVKAGVINSLGERRYAGAVSALAPLAADEDPMIASAAFIALGKIGGQEACAALDGEREGLSPELLLDSLHATLLEAGRLRSAGQTDEAARLYDALLAKETPGHVRAAAFMGKAAVPGEGAVVMVVEALASGDMELAGAAARCVRWVPGERAAEVFADQLPRMSSRGQVMLLEALADRGVPVALAPVVAMAESKDEAVRLAALKVICGMGGSAWVKPLAEIAATTDNKRARETARNALDTLRGPEVDETMTALAKSGETEIRIEIIRALRERNAVAAAPALLQLAGDAGEVAEVREASFKAVADVAGPDTLRDVVRLLAGLEGDAMRGPAERAARTLAKRTPDPEERVRVMLDGLAAAETAAAKCSIYRLLGQLGDSAFLAALREAGQAGEGDAKDVALRALIDWPNEAGLDDIARIAKDGESAVYRELALRSLLAMLRTSSALPAAGKIAYFEKAMDVAQNLDQKRMVLGALAQADTPLVLPLVETYLADAALREEAVLTARQAILGRCQAFASRNGKDAPNMIDMDMDSRWSTGEAQEQFVSFGIDLGAEYMVRWFALDNTPSPEDYLLGYKVFVSVDSSDWLNPVAEGEGSGPVTAISFEPKRGRYISIVQTASGATAPCSVHEVRFVNLEKGELGLAPVPETAAP